jgi:metal-responsive CopG/Arc/MetJ family transcriptional regulator
MQKAEKVEKQVTFWVTEDWLWEFDEAIRKAGFQTRATAIRFACREQMKRWKR